MENVKPSNNGTLGKLLGWGLVGYLGWSLLPDNTKTSIRCFLSNLGTALAENQRQKAELEKQQANQIATNIFLKPLLPLSTPEISNNFPAHPISPDNSSELKGIPTSTSNTTYTEEYTETDYKWLKSIKHPSIILILGKRGSGKSATAYRLLEIFRHGPKPYVVGVPASKRHLLPEWIGIAVSLEEVPPGAITIVDEAYILYHARNSTASESRDMSKLINLSRQREQTIIFVTQEARQIDKNIASSANVIIFKDLGILQLQFERPEFNELIVKAKEAFATTKGDKRRWNYLYSQDTDFAGLIENELPSFWKPGLSRMFAGDISAKPMPRQAKKLTLAERIQKARDMRVQEKSYPQIAAVLGVSVGTVFNYLKGYTYR